VTAMHSNIIFVPTRSRTSAEPGELPIDISKRKLYGISYRCVVETDRYIGPTKLSAELYNDKRCPINRPRI